MSNGTSIFVVFSIKETKLFEILNKKYTLYIVVKTKTIRKELILKM